MDITLTDLECRVLGCLIEKEITTPEYYPLTVNSLTAACNQKSNRNPTMELSDGAVQATVEDMKNKHLIWERRVVGARTLKYEHNLPGIAPFTAAETALLCELMVRGPQTPGELRGRASRMHPFKDINEVEEALKNLYTRTDGPFIAELPRQRGTKENRYAHLFSGQPAAQAATVDNKEPVPEVKRAVVEAERIDALERDVSGLKTDVEALKQALAELRKLPG
jgi:uncharacterized protein